MEKLINIKEAAELLGVCARTLKNWDDAGKLKAYKTIGGHRRYKMSDLEKTMESKK